MMSGVLLKWSYQCGTHAGSNGNTTVKVHVCRIFVINFKLADNKYSFNTM